MASYTNRLSVFLKYCIWFCFFVIARIVPVLGGAFLVNFLVWTALTRNNRDKRPPQGAWMLATLILLGTLIGIAFPLPWLLPHGTVQ